jgi:hypothetical protein
VWRIFRIKTGPAKLVATVRAPDAKTAVKMAAVKLRLTDPEKVKRLAAFAFTLRPSTALAADPVGQRQAA